MPNPIRDYFKERERTLEKRIAELEAAHRTLPSRASCARPEIRKI